MLRHGTWFFKLCIGLMCLNIKYIKMKHILIIKMAGGLIFIEFYFEEILYVK